MFLPGPDFDAGFFTEIKEDNGYGQILNDFISCYSACPKYIGLFFDQPMAMNRLEKIAFLLITVILHGGANYSPDCSQQR